MTQTGAVNGAGYEAGMYRGQATLGQGDFLQLLIAQLKSQDPLSPMKDQEFAAQVAQFSSLESIQGLSQQFSRFVDFHTRFSQVGQGTALIGKQVDIAVADGIVSGKVSAVRVGVEGVCLVVDGREYAADSLLEVRADS